MCSRRRYGIILFQMIDDGICRYHCRIVHYGINCHSLYMQCDTFLIVLFFFILKFSILTYMFRHIFSPLIYISCHWRCQSKPSKDYVVVWPHSSVSFYHFFKWYQHLKQRIDFVTLRRQQNTLLVVFILFVCLLLELERFFRIGWVLL